MGNHDIFPEVLETDRLVLRRYSVSDSGDLLALIDDNRNLLLENFPGLAQNIHFAEDTEGFIRQQSISYSDKTAFCYGIWKMYPEQLIGQLLVKNITWDVPAAELSYFIGKRFHRLGFATEAITAILNVAFKRLEFNRIFVRVIKKNAESILLAQKLGFEHEGLHRQEFRCGRGILHDVHYFSLIRKSWQ